MNKLTPKQKEDFWRDGVLLIENAVDSADLQRLKDVFAGWVEDSRATRTQCRSSRSATRAVT